MSLRTVLSAITLPLTLAACTSAATLPAPPMSDPQPSEGADSCNHERAQSVVGEPATPANVERARTLAGARTARVLKPGQVVTMEYLPGRLNIYVDEKNIITSVRCG